ncbi:MAG: GIY-YIG nuclease family protein [Candidatus Gracilibacteria bacterium]|nr:GIY-YIG nuclease family protein [Candidatus Gracilibacteria bacterium]
MFFVYILQCSNGKFYVGYIGNLDRRLLEHKRGNTKSTKYMGDKTLVGYFLKNTKTEAIVLEKQIKRSGHITRYIENVDFIKSIMGY